MTTKHIKIIKIDNKYGATNRNTSQNREYLNQYYKIRAKSFNKLLASSIYKEEPNSYDKRKSTVFFLAVDVDTNAVVAGGQINVKSPNEQIKLKIESDKDKSKEDSARLQVRKLLSGIGLDPELDQITYGEIAGVAVDPDYKKQVVGIELQSEIFRSAEFKALDFVVCAATERNVEVAKSAFAKAGLNPDDIQNAGTVQIDNKFPVTVLIYSPNKIYNLKNMQHLQPDNLASANTANSGSVAICGSSPRSVAKIAAMQTRYC